MAVRSTFNNRLAPLAGLASFTGEAEETKLGNALSVAVYISDLSTLTIEQSPNRTNWYIMKQTTIEPNVRYIIQEPCTLAYFRITIHNEMLTAQAYCNLVTSLVQELTQGVDIRPLSSATDSVTTISGDSKTSTGDIIVNGTSGSATRSVYLMNVGTWYRVASVGNTSGAVWNSIGAIVGGESIPTVGRLFKCLSVPGNVAGQGTVYDVEYSDTLTATPTGTQDVNIVSTVTVPVSGSVALLPAADPTLTIGTTRIRDTYGDPIVTTAGNLMVGINNIYTANPLHTIVDSGAITETNSGTISSTLTSLNGKVTACNTGAVVITTLPAITLSKTTSSITAWENPSLIISFDSGTTVREIKASAGSLQSLSLVNDNNALAFVSLYDNSAGSIIAGTTPPLAVIVIQKDQAIQLVTHNLIFSVAISFYVATAYNGASPLTNVYLTASYN